jgi:hypothetical protein
VALGRGQLKRQLRLRRRGGRLERPYYGDCWRFSDLGPVARTLARATAHQAPPFAGLLQEWIGDEVVDPAGEKLGKVAEVFYRGNEPLVIEIRSGIAGRKHHLAELRGATVSKSHLRLSSSELVPTDGGLGRCRARTTRRPR